MPACSPRTAAAAADGVDRSKASWAARSPPSSGIRSQQDVRLESVSFHGGFVSVLASGVGQDGRATEIGGRRARVHDLAMAEFDEMVDDQSSAFVVIADDGVVARRMAVASHGSGDGDGLRHHRLPRSRHREDRPGGTRADAPGRGADQRGAGRGDLDALVAKAKLEDAWFGIDIAHLCRRTLRIS